MKRVDLKSPDDLRAASRSEDAPYSQDPPETCYFIHNGTYFQKDRSLLLYVFKGGTSANPRVFVGESRTGVVIRGRATTGDSDNPGSRIANIVFSNMTFDLSGGLPGYDANSDAFNTLTLNANASNVRVDHVTFTGDCRTGLRGAHIETDGIDGLVVDSTLIENFGHCDHRNGLGHEDHGVYLANGKNITIRNSVVRGNSSRGIQFYTLSDEGDTLDNVTIERNRIYANGHADYEDGIVLNGSGPDTISNVTVARNLIYKNFYSGVRWAGPATSAVQVLNNTFYHNGSGSSSADRSEVNVDDVGTAGPSTVTRNLFSVGVSLINNCNGGARQGFALKDNLSDQAAPSGSSGDCVASLVRADAQLADPENGDFHPRNAQATAYGAYAP